MTYRGFTIEKTACYPCAYKIQQIGCRASNATCYFYETVKKAKQAIDWIVCRQVSQKD